jgi:hypothetical protein
VARALLGTSEMRIRTVLFAFTLVPTSVGSAIAARPKASGFFRSWFDSSDRGERSERHGGWGGGGGWRNDDSPFERKTLLASIAAGEERVVGFDRSSGAQTPVDGSSRFVVIRDAFGGRRHILGIPTAAGKKQAESIYDTAALNAGEVGAIFRAVLMGDRAATGRTVSDWRARVNLPGRISQDVLHVHGDEGDPQRPLSGPGSSQGDFMLHDGREIGATTNLPTAQLDARHEELLGRMVLAVAKLGKARGIMNGSIEVSRSDAQLTVRLKKGGAFAWGINE